MTFPLLKLIIQEVLLSGDSDGVDVHGGHCAQHHGGHQDVAGAILSEGHPPNLFLPHLPHRLIRRRASLPCHGPDHSTELQGVYKCVWLLTTLSSSLFSPVSGCLRLFAFFLSQPLFLRQHLLSLLHTTLVPAKLYTRALKYQGTVNWIRMRAYAYARERWKLIL